MLASCDSGNGQCVYDTKLSLAEQLPGESVPKLFQSETTFKGSRDSNQATGWTIRDSIPGSGRSFFLF